MRCFYDFSYVCWDLSQMPVSGDLPLQRSENAKIKIKLYNIANFENAKKLVEH